MESSCSHGECTERLDSGRVGSLKEGRGDGKVVDGRLSQGVIHFKSKLFYVWFVVVVVVVIVICKTLIYCLICSAVLLDIHCKVEAETLILSVKIPRNLVIVVLVVAGACWHLHFIDVGMFCDICSPLHHCTRLTNIQDDTLEKFKLQDLPTISWAMLYDSILILMKLLESAGNPIKGVGSKHGCLCKITEVEKGTESHKKLLRDLTSYHAYEVMLDCAMITANNLLQLGYTFAKFLIANGGLDDGEVKIQLVSPYHCNTPLHIMIPSKLVKMVQGFYGNKVTRL